MLNCLSSRAAASVVKHCLLAPALVPPCRSCAVLLPGSRSVYVTPGARPAALHFQRIVRRNVATMSGQATATSRNADGQGAVHISNAFLSGAQQKQRLWLILLNHTLPDITTALWDRGECHTGCMLRTSILLDHASIKLCDVCLSLNSAKVCERPSVCMQLIISCAPMAARTGSSTRLQSLNTWTSSQMQLLATSTLCAQM